MADSGEVDVWLKKELDGLDGELQETGQGPGFDAFVNLYNQLPEHRLTGLLGGDVTLQFVDQPDPVTLRPLATYGPSLIAQRLDIDGQVSAETPFVFIKGSLFLPDTEVACYDNETIQGLVLALSARTTRVLGVTESSQHYAYVPDGLCRDAFMVYGQAYSLEELLEPEVELQTAAKPLNGAVITVQQGLHQPLTLFVNADFQAAGPIAGATQRVGNGYRPLLSYMD